MDEKATVVPLHYLSGDMPASRFVIDTDTAIENVAGRFTQENFELWQEYLSIDDKRGLPRMKFAIVHKFISPGHIGSEEKRSEETAHKVFVALRLIRPTRERYSYVQYKVTPQGADVFSFTHPEKREVVVPRSERLNRIGYSDLEKLPDVFRRLAQLAHAGPENTRRAVRLYETGYANILDPALQFAVWAMGIEAALVSDDVPLSAEEVVARVGEVMDLHTNVYKDLRSSEENAELSIGEALPDILRLRNIYVHGCLPPSDLRHKKKRLPLSGQPVEYDEMLWEAAPFILRNLILGQLNQKHGNQS